jgi:hypothetical protein
VSVVGEPTEKAVSVAVSIASLRTSITRHIDVTVTAIGADAFELVGSLPVDPKSSSNTNQGLNSSSIGARSGRSFSAEEKSFDQSRLIDSAGFDGKRKYLVEGTFSIEPLSVGKRSPGRLLISVRKPKPAGAADRASIAEFGVVTFALPEIEVTGDPLLGADSTLIGPLDPPKSATDPNDDAIGLTWRRWSRAVSAVSAIILALALWELFRRRGSNDVSPTVETDRPIDPLARLSSLEQEIGSGKAPTRDDFRIARDVALAAAGLTGSAVVVRSTNELKALADRSGWPADANERFDHLLDLTDVERFQRRDPTAAELLDCVGLARTVFRLIARRGQ